MPDISRSNTNQIHRLLMGYKEILEEATKSALKNGVPEEDIDMDTLGEVLHSIELTAPSKCIDHIPAATIKTFLQTSIDTNWAGWTEEDKQAFDRLLIDINICDDS